MSLNDYSKFFATTLLILSLTNPLYIQAIDTFEQDDETSFEQDPKLLEQTRKQLKELDFTLEQLAQAINNGSIKVSKKDEAREHVLNLRQLIEKNLDYKTKSALSSTTKNLINLEKKIIARTNELILKNFEDLSDFNENDHPRALRSVLPVTSEILQDELNSCKGQLCTLENYIKQSGISPINQIARNIEKFDKEWKTSNIVVDLSKRVLPYFLLSSYIIYILHEKALPQWPWLSKLKNTIGSKPSQLTKHEAKLTSSTLIEDTKTKDSESFSLQANIDKATEKTEKVAADQKLQGSSKIDYENKGGFFGDFMYKFGPLIKLEETPLLSLGIGATCLPVIKKDMQSLSKWTLKKTRKAFAQLKGESFDDGSRACEAKVTYRDVIGNDHAKAQLTKIVKYFKEKETLDRSGAMLNRGYLLLGPLDIAKNLARATAKEISQEFKAQGKKDVCKVYEIHASELVQATNKSASKAEDKEPSDLASMLKEAEESSPCIVILEELDWLCSQDSIFAETWAKLLCTINSIAKSKKSVFVLATAQNREAIDKILGSAERIGTIINCELPTLEDRESFLEKELKDRCINRSLFDLSSLAQETERCSYSDLNNVIKRAINIAYTNHETLQSKHIEQSINEIVHNIRTQEVIKNDNEKQLLASYFAGKALAHIMLAPQSKLVKVTILPVDSKDGRVKQGELITYKDPSYELCATESEIEKSCIIELAGIEAQRLLIETIAPSLNQKVKQAVVKELSPIIFEGLNPSTFSKEQVEKKKLKLEARIDELKDKASTLMFEHKEQLKLIAQYLEHEQILTVHQIQEILN